MNLSPQNIINALEKLLPQHPEDESQTENQNFIFVDPDFKEIDIKIEGHDNAIEWVSIHNISSTGTGTEEALFIDPESFENKKFLEKSVIEGVNDLEFLKYITNIIHWNLEDSALIFVASKSDLFKKVFDQSLQLFNENGIYVFTFYKVIFRKKLLLNRIKNINQSYHVIIDNNLPCIAKEHEMIPYIARSSNQSEFWMSLIEKVNKFL